MTTARQRRGSRAFAAGMAAEAHARETLENAGFVLLAERCRTPYGEIDLIAANDSLILFVEVKQRRTLDEAAYALRLPQQRRLLAAAEYLLQTQPSWQRENTRCDLMIYDVAGDVAWIEDILRDG
ncbi:YraN family protein [Asaia bogorensis]|uniref:YraN family protein n=2 Tax=Acetobacteraceae TaxID=433 RepID=UPI0004CFA346